MARLLFAAVICTSALSAFGQQPDEGAAAPPSWQFRARLELRANYRNSREQKLPLKFPFPSSFLPVGQTVGFEETVDSGAHVELSVAQVRLDATFGRWFNAHAQVHAQDLYRRNPTSEDRKIDADELYLRFGEKPEFLDRPSHSSLFLQVGKAPKMEKQPVRLLESYGLAATSFNRFEDIQALAGGTVGRNFYWRLQLANGNPLYFRDPNALAGDNGIKALLTKNPDPPLKSGFPILYNTESEGYFFDRTHTQFGQGLGYRWQNVAETFGFDAIAFHYRRRMSERDELTGTFYGADIDFLRGPEGANISLPVSGDRKEETGGRVYVEWGRGTTIAQFTKQLVAGLHRQGYEVETGYRIPFAFGPSVGGEALFQSIQPALRVSGLTNRFRGPATFVAPSVWWPWTKIDVGLRAGFARNVDLTVEYARHNIGGPKFKLKPNETLVTLRVRI